MSAILDTLSGGPQSLLHSTLNNGGERGVDFPGGFRITEFVNGSAPKTMNGVPNPLVLTGNQMPFTPFEWGGEQRLIKDYYPGNPEPATQVLGGKEGELKIKGRFKDKRLSDPTLYGASFQLALAVEAIRRRGNLLKFELHGPAGDWRRYGFLENAQFKMDKQSWVDYEMTFFIVSTTQPKNNYFTSDSIDAPDSINSSLITASLNFTASYSAIPKSMPQSLSGFLNGLISNVAAHVNLVTNFVQSLIASAQSLEASANRALGLIKNARTSISVFRREIDSLAHNFSNYSTSGSAAQQPSDAYKNFSFISEAGAGSVSLSQYLAAMQAQFEAISQTIPIGRYKVISGDTLQRISVRYYGVVDNWQLIYDHNKLQSTVLVPGAILEIPRA